MPERYAGLFQARALHLRLSPSLVYQQEEMNKIILKDDRSLRSRAKGRAFHCLRAGWKEDHTIRPKFRPGPRTNPRREP